MLSQQFAWASPSVLAFILSMPTAVTTVTTVLGRSNSSLPTANGRRSPAVQQNLPRTLQVHTMSVRRAA